MKKEAQKIEKVSFTVLETAERLSTGKDTVYALIRAGELRCMLLPTKSIPDFEIERFMRKAIEENIDYSDILKKERAAAY